MVEWKKLGSLCTIKTGKLNANAQVENGKYPFFTCDASPYRIDDYAFDTEAIIISGNGSQVGHFQILSPTFSPTLCLFSWSFSSFANSKLIIVSSG